MSEFEKEVVDVKDDSSSSFEKDENLNYEKKWYIIHTYSGYEKKVKADLEKRIVSLNLTDRVFRILVPEEEVIEEKRDKKVKSYRKLFPSYVMIEMLSVKEENELGLGYRVDSEAWYVIRNTNGVTGFVGIGSDPIPLSDDEAEKLIKFSDPENMENDSINLSSLYSIGDEINIKKGSFEGQTSKITEVDTVHEKVKVMLDFFGRQTPVELNYDEIEKVK